MIAFGTQNTCDAVTAWWCRVPRQRNAIVALGVTRYDSANDITALRHPDFCVDDGEASMMWGKSNEVVVVRLAATPLKSFVLRSFLG